MLDIPSVRYNKDMSTFKKLRQQYKKFIYHKYSWEIVNNNLEIEYAYKIEPDLVFSPTLIINNVNQKMVDVVGKNKIDSYIFNIGMAEMFSYWKLTASSVIEIRAGSLNKEQIDWWHNLLIKGMGEYFFVNNIQFTADNFVRIISNSEKQHSITNKNNQSISKDKIMIPIGGGKDSSVTLEILTKLQKEVGAFLVNPTQAAIDIVNIKKIKNIIKVDRNIDHLLYKLNQKKYLNGHVPISAFFAFLSIFTADLFGFNLVAISNERSSNEGNVIFCNQEINHQYSKTYEFEKKFQDYSQKYLPSSPIYFSFLRPLYELQIAKVFSEMEQYQTIFRSCNRGQKTNSWCNKCSKCLFAYTILFPFLENDKIADSFKTNLFEDISLWTIAKELLGFSEKKPLECVGTHEETIVAFYLSIKKYIAKKQKLPALLEKINKEIISKEQALEKRAQIILSSWNKNNLVPEELEIELKKYV